MTDVPAAALDAAAWAYPSANRDMLHRALLAAEPHITAAAAAAERDRIRQLAIRYRAECYQRCTDPDCGGHLTATAHSHHLTDFADLLQENP